MSPLGSVPDAASVSRRRPCGDLSVPGRDRGSPIRTSASRAAAFTCAQRDACAAWKKIKSFRGLQLRPENTG